MYIQDLKRIYTTIHFLLASLRSLSIDNELIAQFAHMSLDEFIADRLPSRLQEILQDPNVAANPPNKSPREQKFENVVSNNTQFIRTRT